jgi:eukaryotic-like serine/threonine-protein kinase
MSEFLKTGGGLLSATKAGNIDSKDANLPNIGEEIGGFVLTHLISKTDFSYVFEAHKITESVTQTVAVKIMSAKHLNHSIAPLFEQEKALLASLSHPAIAAFIDAGKTSGGHSYIVMERIQGIDILTYCNRKRLSIKQRVALLVEVLKVVKFAHSRLVVHSDLKPSNILVTEDGYIKLLDFGISNLIEDNEPDQDRKRYFTPQYAAPEQLENSRTTVATDIYQLGAVLFRLVCGVSPYTYQVSDITSIYQAILSEQIQQSTSKYRAIQSAFSKRKIAMQRGCDVSKLPSKIGRELDRVILHSLNKQQDARYQMIDDFQNDLQCWLEQKPISLIKSWSYKLRKYVIRNALSLSIASVSILLLGSGTVVYIKDINKQRLETQEQARYAEAISSFLLSTLLDVNGKLDNFDELTLTQVIQNANETLNDSQDLPPEVRKELALLLANANTRMQNFINSKQILEAHTTILAQLQQESFSDVEVAVKYTEVLYDLGDYEEAQKLIIKLLKQSPSYTYPVNYFVSKLAAEIFRKNAQYDDALQYALNALDMAKENLKEPSKPILNLLGGIYINLGQYKNAINYFEQGLNTPQSLEKSPSFRDLVLQGNLAILYDITGNHTKAKQLIMTTIEQTEAFFPNRYSSIASFYNTYGNILKNLNLLDDAINVIKHSISLYETHFGEDYAKLISPYTNLTESLILAGQCKDARVSHQRLTTLRNSHAQEIDSFVCNSKSSLQKVF